MAEVANVNTGESATANNPHQPRVSPVPAPHTGLPGVGSPSPGKGERHSVKHGRATNRAAEVLAEMRGGKKPPVAPMPQVRETSGPLTETTGLAPNPTASTKTVEVPQGQPADEPIAKVSETGTEGKPSETEQKKPDETDVEAKTAEEREREEKQWREIRRRKKQQRREQEELRSERMRLENERAAAARDAAADAELKKNNPTLWLEKHGYSFSDVAKQAVARESETPEQKRLREAEDRAIRAEQRLDDFEKREKEREDREKRDAAERNRVEAVRSLNDEAKTAYSETKSSYPTLTQFYEEADIIRAVTEVRIANFRRTGREVTAEQALAHIEGNAKKEKERFLRSQNGNGSGSERATLSAKAEETRAVVRPVTNKDSVENTDAPTALSPRERRAGSLKIASRFFDRG